MRALGEQIAARRTDPVSRYEDIEANRARSRVRTDSAASRRRSSNTHRSRPPGGLGRRGVHRPFLPLNGLVVLPGRSTRRSWRIGPMDLRTTDYHTAGEPFRIVVSDIGEISGSERARTARDRGGHGADRPRAPALVSRAARPCRHVRLLRRPARRRGCRLRRAVLAQGRLLDGVWARHDRTRRMGGGIRASRGPHRRAGRRGDRRPVGARHRARALCGRQGAGGRVRQCPGERDRPRRRRRREGGRRVGWRVLRLRAGGGVRPTRDARGSARADLAGRAVKAALDGTPVSRHPHDDRLSGIYGTVLTERVGRATTATWRSSPTARSTARRRGQRPRRGQRCCSPTARSASATPGATIRSQERASRPNPSARSPRACSPRFPALRSGPASIASCSTRATRSGPVSCCGEPDGPSKVNGGRRHRPPSNLRHTEAVSGSSGARGAVPPGDRPGPGQPARGEDDDDQAGAGRGADRRRGQIESRIGRGLGGRGRVRARDRREDLRVARLAEAPRGSIGIADAAGAPRVPAIAAPLRVVAIVRLIVVESMSTPSWVVTAWCGRCVDDPARSGARPWAGGGQCGARSASPTFPSRQGRGAEPCRRARIALRVGEARAARSHMATERPVRDAGAVTSPPLPEHYWAWARAALSARRRRGAAPRWRARRAGASRRQPRRTSHTGSRDAA